MKNALFATILVFLSSLMMLLLGEVGIRTWDKIKGVHPLYTHNPPETLAVPSGYFNYDIKPNLSIVIDSKNHLTVQTNKVIFNGLNHCQFIRSFLSCHTI